MRLVVSKLFGLASAIVTEKTTRAAIYSVAAIYLGWDYSLRPEDRLKADPSLAIESLRKLSESAVLAMSGWVFAAIVMGASGYYIWSQHQRIKAQGDENMRLRQLVDPQRLSAGNKEALDNYAKSSMPQPGK